ncbi:PREDICTED: CLAVATA3/ESR (CLE)-related protein 9-like [Camelina sativa]|uniref:CLAVATA3/ESR (CLE)-related protein 9-like n=1 Tax=Camelina sativa TaxID=90675 RepID=A0ABM0YCQ0_CAMSA|nr:PREDICTED: CLAVATA3/ESR (CLE)-related protein 9-like [Camelina sativa]
MTKTTTHKHRPILILLLFVSLLLKTSTASAATVAEGNITSSSYRYRTHRFVPRVHHPYYVTPHGSCDSFTRPYARSMCIELQRIHRSSRKQPILSPPPPEIDPRYGVDKRLVPSGPNPLHN